MARKPVSSRIARFFKVMLNDFKHQLRIPPCFTKQSIVKLREKATVKGPSGKPWKMKLKKTGDSLFITEGWREFAEYHCLQMGEFLVFTYDGNSRFRVKIFGLNACEKDRAFFVTKPAKRISQNRDEVETRRKRDNNPKRGQQKKQRSILPNKTGKIIVSKGQERKANEDERTRALESINGFKTKHPHFLAIMRPFNLKPISSYLNIPRRFLKKHDLSGKSSMRLGVGSGKTWKVGIRKTSDGRLRITGGWHDFSVGNNLKEGDVCIFALSPRRDGFMRVRIF